MRDVSELFKEEIESEEFKILPQNIQDNLKKLMVVDTVQDSSSIDPGDFSSYGMEESERIVNPGIPLVMVQSSLRDHAEADGVDVKSGGFIWNIKSIGETKNRQEHVVVDLAGDPIKIDKEFSFIPISKHDVRSKRYKDGPNAKGLDGICYSTLRPGKPDIVPPWGMKYSEFDCYMCPLGSVNSACPTSVRITGIGFDYSKLYVLSLTGQTLFESYWNANLDWQKESLKNMLSRNPPMYKNQLWFKTEARTGVKKGQQCRWNALVLTKVKETPNVIQKICAKLFELSKNYHVSRINRDRTKFSRMNDKNRKVFMERSLQQSQQNYHQQNQPQGQQHGKKHGGGDGTDFNFGANVQENKHFDPSSTEVPDWDRID